jgi:surfactin synthase thioesterase subunit
MRRVHLICLPFAGAGASFYSPWAQLASDGLEIVAIQLPGREWRLAEEPIRVVGEAVATLADEVAARVADGPAVLFGHSLGAVLAFELAREFLLRPRLDVVRLIVSGSPGPWNQRTDRATGLPDEEFVRRVEEFAGYAHEALANPYMREVILPAMRADVEMHESYVPSADEPLPVPITAVRGLDDALVSRGQIGEWQAATSREFTLVEVPGGHMYLAEDPRRVLGLVNELTGR